MTQTRRRRTAPGFATEQAVLFENLPQNIPLQEVPRLRKPIWTEQKAQLISRYLYYFVLITRHGTYIDAFAGPQQEQEPDSWAANLVLKNEPKWLRNFYLFERDPEKVGRLEQLQREHESDSGRTIHVYPGDSNQKLRQLLSEGSIEREASFCLLDQRTFECEWATVQELARYRPGTKIELFYFLANHWLDRALTATQDEDLLRAWWGRDDWQILRGMPGHKRAEVMRERVQQELGYRYAQPYPIYESEVGGRGHGCST